MPRVRTERSGTNGNLPPLRDLVTLTILSTLLQVEFELSRELAMVDPSEYAAGRGDERNSRFGGGGIRIADVTPPTSGDVPSVGGGSPSRERLRASGRSKTDEATITDDAELDRTIGLSEVSPSGSERRSVPDPSPPRDWRRDGPAVAASFAIEVVVALPASERGTAMPKTAGATSFPRELGAVASFALVAFTQPASQIIGVAITIATAGWYVYYARDVKTR